MLGASDRMELKLCDWCREKMADDEHYICGDVVSGEIEEITVCGSCSLDPRLVPYEEMV